uniref:IP14013p n=1 Tax=Drosophila melanogaster TaxID=7227 RepID=Q4V577_DROME|nr:IP14013p [Drosophila melanogaster]
MASTRSGTSGGVYPNQRMSCFSSRTGLNCIGSPSCRHLMNLGSPSCNWASRYIDLMLHHDNFSNISELLAPGGTSGQTFSSSSIET